MIIRNIFSKIFYKKLHDPKCKKECGVANHCGKTNYNHKVFKNCPCIECLVRIMCSNVCNKRKHFYINIRSNMQR
jgi:hypothetical protein